MQISTLTVRVGLENRDWVEVTVNQSTAGHLVIQKISVFGCDDLLKFTDWLRQQKEFPFKVEKIPPHFSHHVKQIAMELCLKVNNKWNPPYQEEELCHCRMVPTKTVQEAIMSGCITVDQVAKATTAGTACGTCRKDTQSLIEYRLK